MSYSYADTTSVAMTGLLLILAIIIIGIFARSISSFLYPLVSSILYKAVIALSLLAWIVHPYLGLEIPRQIFLVAFFVLLIIWIIVEIMTPSSRRSRDRWKNPDQSPYEGVYYGPRDKRSDDWGDFGGGDGGGGGGGGE